MRKIENNFIFKALFLSLVAGLMAVFSAPTNWSSSIFSKIYSFISEHFNSAFKRKTLLHIPIYNKSHYRQKTK